MFVSPGPLLTLKDMVMRTRSLWAATAALVLSITASTFAGDKIPLEQVPPQVFDSVAARFPDVQFLSAELKRKDKQPVYELKIRSVGKKFEVKVTPFGQIVDIDD